MNDRFIHIVNDNYDLYKIPLNCIQAGVAANEGFLVCVSRTLNIMFLHS